MITPILVLLALVISTIMFPIALKIAQKYDIVDNPDARKLQKEPIPVFGGVVIVTGMFIPMMIAAQYLHFIDLWYAIGAIVALWIIGTIDDIRGLSAWVRFILELIIIWLIIWHPNSPENGVMINNMYGLWGRHEISLLTAIPLTLVAGVGIINSINLIDGVDGYSSGYGIVANILFSIIFHTLGNQVLCLFSLVAAASLIPFYMHNVFGKKTKMFIGDGGSLVIGMVITYDVFAMLSETYPCSELENKGVGLAALALAITCIPVFDTLRVMTTRIIQGGSPFQPDKTHLHHLYIDMGFSHVGTSTCIILSNLLVVGVWYLLYRCGLGVTGQFYAVVLMGLTIVAFYHGMRYSEKQNNWLWQIYCRFGAWTRIEQKGIWKVLQKIIDKI